MRSFFAASDLKGKRFCANDRLAQGLLHLAAIQKRPVPFVVGFDNAPVAEQLQLTTIAIPWAELAEITARIVERRMSGDREIATRHILMPRAYEHAASPATRAI